MEIKSDGKKRIIKILLISGGVMMIPITSFLMWKFNGFFIGYPLVYSALVIKYANKKGLIN